LGQVCYKKSKLIPLTASMHSNANVLARKVSSKNIMRLNSLSSDGYAGNTIAGFVIFNTHGIDTPASEDKR